MASATASNVIRGLSLKSHFTPIWELGQLIQSFDIFFKSFLFKSAIPWFEWDQFDGFVEQFFLDFASSLNKSKFNINWANTQIGTKCDFRDRPRITFEAVADAMFA